MINKQFDKLILIQEKFNDFVYYYSYIFNIYEKSLNIIHQINMCIKNIIFDYYFLNIIEFNEQKKIIINNFILLKDFIYLLGDNSFIKEPFNMI